MKSDRILFIQELMAANTDGRKKELSSGMATTATISGGSATIYHHHHHHLKQQQLKATMMMASIGQPELLLMLQCNLEEPCA